SKRARTLDERKTAKKVYRPDEEEIITTSPEFDFTKADIQGLDTAKKDLYQPMANIDDIDKELAYRAYANVSWTPEKRAEDIRKHYVEHINSLQEELMEKVPLERHNEVKEALEKYKEKYKEKQEEQLHRLSRIASSAVVGRSNFPASTMKKRNEVYDRKEEEFLAWDARAREAIKKRFGLISGPISSDDPKAIQKIQREIDKRKKQQEEMKRANKIVRSKSLTEKEKEQALVKMGYDRAEVKKILKEDRSSVYPSYMLSNNSANIRRLEQRLERLKEAKSTPTTVKKVGNVRIEDNTEDNRLRIRFDDIPSENIRKELKSRGFRWSPKNKAWQRYRSNAAEYYAEQIAEQYNQEKREVDK
ncbi:MAG: hypothetical protein ACTSX6_07595, partial [Candidatus Heimdallarchaeaceae archaeon]